MLACQRRAADAGESGEIDGRSGQLALAGPAEHEQLVDDMREAIDLRSRGVELSAGFGVGQMRGGFLQTQTQTGERCTQLV